MGERDSQTAMDSQKAQDSPAAPAVIMNLPNRLTVARMGMVLLFIVLLSFENLPCLILGYLVFLAATITDYYDGKIARDRNLITNFGKLLDPVADKILIAAAFVMLMLFEDLRIPGWVVVVIIAREFLVTGARSLAASEGIVIGANVWGKIKAVLQMTYIYCFLGFVILKDMLGWAVSAEVLRVYGQLLKVGSFWAAIVVALFTVYSGLQFARINWKALKLGSG